MKILTFEFEELPLIIENGFEAAPVNGCAVLSYFDDGEWGIQSIYLDGHKRNKWTLEQRMEAIRDNKVLKSFTHKRVEVDAMTPIHLAICSRLDGEWAGAVQDKVMEAIAEDRECAAGDYADFRRGQRVEAM